LTEFGANADHFSPEIDLTVDHDSSGMGPLPESDQPFEPASWRRRVRLSRFARYLLMRAILVPGELAAVLVVLYLFGTLLPAAARHTDPCSFAAGACSGCDWSNPSCVLIAFGGGFANFAVRMFTGRWGFASFGASMEPAGQYLAWFLPYSIELAVVALVVTVAVAYPLGLLAGVRKDSPIDFGTRAASTLGLLVPSFFLVLIVFAAIYEPFASTFGDPPYGILPSPNWFLQHGGTPSWIGAAQSTSPTGFPIVDSLWNHDWVVAGMALLKTGLQACLIALIYVPIYLRFLRQAVSKTLESTWVVAARARGLGESQIVWHHAGRRVLPLLFLVFASTVPAFLGTQMVIEVLVGDPGVGPVLLGELTRVPFEGFGFAGTGPAAVTSGNFWQVLIFLSALLILVTRLASDGLAHYLDPRLLSEGRS
jgi:ABC-type dipeptide/oligopeptide/nickel transport system permease component